MARKNLKNKPLVEAILEVRWGPQAPAQNMPSDPHYKLLLGRLYDRVRGNYPVHEQLATASIPDEMVPQMVQHRFRSDHNEWPLVQLGPGIFSLNETSKYDWDDFRARAKASVTTLFEAHPEPNNFKIESLVLRYINAVEFNSQSEDAFAFLKEKLKVSISLPATLFDSNAVVKRPDNFAWQTSFPCKKPDGTIVLKFDTGQIGNKPILRWETMVLCSGSDVPKMPDAFGEWLSAAHNVLDDWFFKLIAGDLETSFDT